MPEKPLHFDNPHLQTGMIASDIDRHPPLFLFLVHSDIISIVLAIILEITRMFIKPFFHLCPVMIVKVCGVFLTPFFLSISLSLLPAFRCGTCSLLVSGSGIRLKQSPAIGTAFQYTFHHLALQVPIDSRARLTAPHNSAAEHGRRGKWKSFLALMGRRIDMADMTEGRFLTYA